MMANFACPLGAVRVVVATKGAQPGLFCALLRSGFLPVWFLQRAEGFKLLKQAHSNPELAPAQLGCVHK